MPLPNSQIVHAFFESYLNIRKDKWDLDPSNTRKELSDKTGHTKINVCTDYLEKSKAAKNLTDWIAILIDISTKAQSEDITAKNYRNGVTGIFVKSVVDEPLLLETMLAVRSYILEELQSENDAVHAEFDKIKSELKNQKLVLSKANNAEKARILKEPDERKKIEATSNLKKKEDELDLLITKLAYMGDFEHVLAKSEMVNATAGSHNLEMNVTIPSYLLLKKHGEFFDNVIKPRDSEAKRLGEKTFDDMKNNVVCKNRTLVVCANLLKDKETDLAKAAAKAKEASKPAEIKATDAVKVTLPVNKTAADTTAPAVPAPVVAATTAETKSSPATRSTASAAASSEAAKSIVDLNDESWGYDDGSRPSYTSAATMYQPKSQQLVGGEKKADNNTNSRQPRSKAKRG